MCYNLTSLFHEVIPAMVPLLQLPLICVYRSRPVHVKILYTASINANPVCAKSYFKPTIIRHLSILHIN